MILTKLEVSKKIRMKWRVLLNCKSDVWKFQMMTIDDLKKYTSNGFCKIYIRVVVTFVVFILLDHTIKSLGKLTFHGFPSHSNDDSLAPIWTVFVRQRNVFHAVESLLCADLKLGVYLLWNSVFFYIFWVWWDWVRFLLIDLKCYIKLTSFGKKLLYVIGVQLHWDWIFSKYFAVSHSSRFWLALQPWLRPR